MANLAFGVKFNIGETADTNVVVTFEFSQTHITLWATMNLNYLIEIGSYLSTVGDKRIENVTHMICLLKKIDMLVHCYWSQSTRRVAVLPGI